MTEDKEGRTKKLSMLLIITVTIIIFTTIMSHRISIPRYKSLCSAFPNWTKIGTHLRGFSSLLQRFVTHGGFYRQQFGTPPKRTTTKRTFTLTNYYHSL